MKLDRIEHAGRRFPPNVLVGHQTYNWAPGLYIYRGGTCALRDLVVTSLGTPLRLDSVESAGICICWHA